MTPVLSIVCGTRNRRDSYMRFVNSVIRTASVPTELLIGDASDEAYAPMLVPADLRNVVRFVPSVETPRVGHVKGYDRLFRMATGKWVCWFNDDCEMVDGWDRIAIDFMESHPEVGIGCIYFRDDTGSGLSNEYVVQSLYRCVYPNFGVLSREFGDQLGWFDESLFLYGADTAIGFSALEAGKAVVPIPGCKTIHYREQDESRAENYADARSRQDRTKFDKKWKFKAPELRSFMNNTFGHLKQPETIR